MTRLREIVGDSSRLPERDDPRIEWFEQAGGSSFECAGVRVECVAMDHAPGIDALGFRVRLPGGVVAYSGDTAYGAAVLSLAESADLLIAECGGDRGQGHMEWDDLRELRAALDASTRLLVTHYDPLAVPGVGAPVQRDRTGGGLRRLRDLRRPASPTAGRASGIPHSAGGLHVRQRSSMAGWSPRLTHAMARSASA